MLCHWCKADVFTGAKFCSQCGRRPILNIDPDLLEYLDETIREAVRARVTDQKVLEIETAQEITGRIVNWAKLFGLIVALPLALLTATLTIWGVTSFLDFRGKVNAGRAEISRNIETSKATIKKTTAEAGELGNELATTRAELGSLPNDVHALQSRVSQIEEHIGFVSSPALRPSLKANLEALLQQFQKYCRGIGLSIRPGTVKVHIYPTELPEHGKAAYYDPATSEIQVLSDFADDPSVVLREYMHRQLSLVAVKSVDLRAVEAGLSCYYPASFRDVALCGGWDLNNMDSYEHHRSENPELAVVWGVNVWGGLFWEMRKVLGHEKCDEVLVTFWDQVLSNKSKQEFPQYAATILLENVAKIAPTETARIRSMISARDIPIN